MCEFCGCEGIRSSERPARKISVKEKPVGVGVVAVAAEPKARPKVATSSDQETHPALQRATVEKVTSGGA